MQKDKLVTSRVRNFISRLGFGKLFATRDCLNFGPRSAIDQCLARMVKAGFIVRFTRGVFARMRFGTPIPSLSEIALFKARAFQRRAVQMPRQAKSGRAPFELNRKPTPHGTDGGTSSFSVEGQRLHLKSRCPRKIALADTKGGLIIRALWEVGRTFVTKELVAKVFLDLGREERAEIRTSCHIMPAWLAQKLVWRDEESAPNLPVVNSSSSSIAARS